MAHEGWKNYETWCVALWINNEEPMYDEAREMTRAAFDEPSMRQARYQLAGAIKNWIEEMQPELSGMWADMMGAALSEVDWDEIADTFLKELEEDHKRTAFESQ